MQLVLLEYDFEHRDDATGSKNAQSGISFSDYFFNLGRISAVQKRMWFSSRPASLFYRLRL